MPTFKLRNLTTKQATPIPLGEHVVGRGDEAHVQVSDSSVSRRHARLFNLEDGLYIEDLGSLNGTVCRGEVIKGRKKVKLGDLIHIGVIPFRLDSELSGDAVAVATIPSLDRVNMSQKTEALRSESSSGSKSGSIARRAGEWVEEMAIADRVEV